MAGLPPTTLWFILIFVAVCYGQLTCAPCKLSVQVVYDKLNSSSPIILEKADKLCLASPPIYYNLCLVVVNKTYHRIVDYVERAIPPEKVCQKIGLCRKDQDSAFILEDKAIEASILPILCALDNLQATANIFMEDCTSQYDKQIVCTIS